jgi:hypothetical protein
LNYKLSGVLLLSFLALAIASAQMVVIAGSPGAPVAEDSFDPGDPIVWDGSAWTTFTTTGGS